MTPFDWPVGNPVLFLAAVRRFFDGTEAVGSIWDDITLSDQTIVVNLTGSTIVPPEILDDLITIAQSRANSKSIYDLAPCCHARMLLSGLQVYRGSGFPPKACGNDNVVNKSGIRSSAFQRIGRYNIGCATRPRVTRRSASRNMNEMNISRAARVSAASTLLSIA